MPTCWWVDTRSTPAAASLTGEEWQEVRFRMCERGSVSRQVAIGLRRRRGADEHPTWRGVPSDRAINHRSLHRRDPTVDPDSDLPRKEVIQPHLPVRLPCYDFTPITQPTFDDSLPCGLGHRLRVFQAFVV